MANTWVLPANGAVSLNLKDFDVNFEADLKVNQNGYLDPVIYDIGIDFGKSSVTHDNFIMKLIMW